MLFRPVEAGLWQHREAIDGTYTFEDLLDAHELLDIRAKNQRDYAAYLKANGEGG